MAVEGRRKDFWLWTQRKHVEREYKDQPDKLWDWMKKTVPNKYAESFTRQIPLEIENSTQVQHNVLVVNMPEPRQAIDIPCDAGVIDGDLYDVDATGCTLSVGVDGDVVDTEALEGGGDE